MAEVKTNPMLGRVVLGRYRIVAPLARGGMGIIYLGRLEGAAGFAKPVVIKTVIPEGNDSKGAVQLFAREARILSNLEHPSIVGVLDFGEAGNDYVMVLEYVHGFHLGAWSRFVRASRGDMPIAHAVEAMLPVLDALEFAHGLTRPDGAPLGIVHRDISPANILLDNQGHVKLHDFGIARMADDEFKTQDGTFRGTLSYTAPETLTGTAASPRSDLYGCGVVLYQLISGVNPFKGQQPSETLHRVLTHVPPGLRTLRPDVSEELERVIAKAMAKDPAQRFESAAAFAAALRAARSWSEASATQDLVHTIQADFNGAEMAEQLELEPLALRDKAWRAAVGERVRLGSSPPRRPEMRSETADLRKLRSDPDGSLVTIHAAPSDALLQLASLPHAAAEEERTRYAHSTTAEVSARESGGARASGSRRLKLALLGATGALVLGGAAAFAAFGRAPEPAPTRFLLIEKQPAASPSSEVPASAVAPSQDLASASSATAAEPKAPAALATVATKPVSASSGSSLSAAFQRQQGRIAGCFRGSSSDLGQPQITVHFKIDASGSVQAAELSPANVSGSALGSCILGIARSTHFPATGSAVNFAIPITAVRK
jgi:serine/threonine-protein kinase